MQPAVAQSPEITSQITLSNVSVKEIARADQTYPQAKFAISAGVLKNGKIAKYDISSVDHYVFQINQNTPESWKDDGTHIYETPVLGPGSYTFTAKAFDVSGNFVGTSTVFTVQPLHIPDITDYSKEVTVSGNITLRGTTYPHGQVIISLQREAETPKSFTVQANADGEFFFISDPQTSLGSYTACAYALDSRGAKSLSGAAVSISVKATQIAQFTTWSTNILSLAVPLFALLGILLVGIMYIWHKFLVLRKRIRKETRNFEKDVHKAFDALREDMSEQIIMLKKAKTERELTAEEEKVMKRLKKHLDTVEGFIQKEIESVEKDAI